MDGYRDGKNYRGDVVLDQRRWRTEEKVNDDLSLDNSISILADGYAYENIGNMKYIIWNKVPWKIQSFNINRPRIVIQIGGYIMAKDRLSLHQLLVDLLGSNLCIFPTTSNNQDDIPMHYL